MHDGRGKGLAPPLLFPAVLLLAWASAGCGGSADAAPAVADAVRAGAAAPVSSSGPLVVFLGDSLTGGARVKPEQAFPGLLRARLAEEGLPFRLVVAGVGGDTSAGGLNRLRHLLDPLPDVLVVELGANDGLRRLPLRDMDRNLRRIAREAGERGIRVLLLGMRIPPQVGLQYARGFGEIYERIAEDLDLPLVPFLLKGVAGDPGLNHSDGIHPNIAGHRILAETVLPYLRGVLEELEDLDA